MSEIQQPSEALVLRPETAVGEALPPEAIKPPITAAQGKIDAIANLTMKAYDSASTLKLTPEEIKGLQADFPDEAFKPGAGGKEHLIYIEHAFLRDRLNQVIGVGQWAIVPRNRWAEPFVTAKGTEGSRVYVEAMLVIRGAFVGEAVGAMEYYPKNESQNYGDAVEGAKTAAFRRCAKELGMGLQAWKKDWCEAWWARRRGGRVFPPKNAPGRAATPPPPSSPSAQPSRPAQGSPEPAQAPKKDPAKPKMPTVATKAWALEELAEVHSLDLVLEYFQKVGGALLPSENLDDLPLRFVPSSREELKKLIAAISRFGDGMECILPYKPHSEEPLELPAGKGSQHIAPAIKPEDIKPQGGPKQTDPEWWREVIVPVPRKGQKRDEYMKSPDTIGSLFELRHEDTADGQDARQRLWGFVNHFEAKGWIGHNGKQFPASEADKLFREALDAFADWFAKTHPEEKL